MRNRDTQRSRVYVSEVQAFAELKKEKMTLPECVAFFEQVKKGEYYQSINGYKRIAFKPGRGRRRGAYYGGPRRRIELPRFARNKHYVLHELAHAATERTVDDDAGHHASFCTHYLNLVCDMLGEAEAKKLEQAYVNNKVRYRPEELLYR